MADYNFEATPTLNNGVVEWTLCYLEPYKPKVCNSATVGYPNVKVPQDHLDQTFSYKIIEDHTGLGITFSPDPVKNPPPSYAGPLWIKSNNKPTSLVIHGQIKDLSGAGTPELQFTDKNSHAVTLKYRLNFVDKNGSKVTAIDPDIKNGGKTFASYLNSPIAMAIAAALVVLLLVVFWNRIKPRGRGPGGPAAGGGNPGG